MPVLEYGRIKFKLDVSPEDLKGAAIVTGFRGFGMVGYNVSKFLAFGLGATKIGYVISPPMPPVVLMEEDGAGFPYDIYYSPRAHTVVFVNRALPEKEYADEYTHALAVFAKDMEASVAILAGGLNANFMPEDEKYGYRYVANRFYKGPELSAPEMEEDLGVMGPLALVYIYMTFHEVPAIIILPYAIADQIDVSAAKRGIKIIAEEILKTTVNMESIERYEKALAKEKERLMEMIMSMSQAGEEREEERKKGLYM